MSSEITTKTTLPAIENPDIIKTVIDCKRKFMSDRDTAIVIGMSDATVNRIYNNYLNELKNEIQLDIQKVALIDSIHRSRKEAWDSWELSKKPLRRVQTTKRATKKTGENDKSQMEIVEEKEDITYSPTGNYRFLELLDKMNNTLAEILGLRHLNVNMDIEIVLPKQATNFFKDDEIKSDDAEIIE